jgi:hypothetical protein
LDGRFFWEIFILKTMMLFEALNSTVLNERNTLKW